MNKNIILNTISLLPEEITEFETLFQIKLPDEYRQFMLKYNGIEYLCHSYKGIENYLYNFDLYPLVTPISDTFVGRWTVKSWREDDEYAGAVPDNVLMIGHDPHGNIIAISCDTADFGYVYLYIQDTVGYDCFLISLSFSDIINNMQEDED